MSLANKNLACHTHSCGYFTSPLSHLDSWESAGQATASYIRVVWVVKLIKVWTHNGWKCQPRYFSAAQTAVIVVLDQLLIRYITCQLFVAKQATLMHTSHIIIASQTPQHTTGVPTGILTQISKSIFSYMLMVLVADRPV